MEYYHSGCCLEHINPVFNCPSSPTPCGLGGLGLLIINRDCAISHPLPQPGLIISFRFGLAGSVSVHETLTCH